MVPCKQVESHSRPGIEIDLRRIPRRKILIRKNCPTDSFKEWHQLFSVREVVLEHEWINNATRRGLSGRIELIEWQHFGIPLQIPAQHTATMLVCQYAPKPPAQAKHVDVAILAQASTANGKHPKIPVRMPNREVVLRKHGRA